MESEREKSSVEVEAGKNVVKLKGARGCEVLSAGRMEVFCGRESDGEEDLVVKYGWTGRICGQDCVVSWEDR